MRRYLIIAAVILLLSALIPMFCHRTAPETGSPRPRAAIVDQLYLMEPDPAFIAGATATLESGGFAVELWQGDNITVDLYRHLPQYGYKLIIFRVHSGMLLSMEGGKVEPLQTTYLFTGETYTTTRYVAEQLSDKVSNAMMSNEYPLVFAINSEFIKDDFKGDFDHAVIIAMGCESYYLDDMADAFLQKGASTYIGWSTLVSLEHTDKAALNLLGNLCTANMTVAQTIDRTMSELGHDPYFGSYLKFPPESGDKTLKELIK